MVLIVWQMIGGECHTYGQYALVLRSRAARSAPLHSLVRAKSISILIVRIWRDKVTDSPSFLNISKIKLMFQIDWHLSFGILSLKTPFSTLDFKEYWPAGFPSTSLRNGRSISIRWTILITLLEQLCRKICYILYKTPHGISILFQTPAVPFSKQRFIWWSCLESPWCYDQLRNCWWKASWSAVFPDNGHADRHRTPVGMINSLSAGKITRSALCISRQRTMHNRFIINGYHGWSSTIGPPEPLLLPLNEYMSELLVLGIKVGLHVQRSIPNSVSVHWWFLLLAPVFSWKILVTDGSAWMQTGQLP